MIYILRFSLIFTLLIVLLESVDLEEIPKDVCVWTNLESYQNCLRDKRDARAEHDAAKLTELESFPESVGAGDDAKTHANIDPYQRGLEDAHKSESDATSPHGEKAHDNIDPYQRQSGNLEEGDNDNENAPSPPSAREHKTKPDGVEHLKTEHELDPYQRKDEVHITEGPVSIALKSEPAPKSDQTDSEEPYAAPADEDDQPPKRFTHNPFPFKFWTDRISTTSPSIIADNAIANTNHHEIEAIPPQPQSPNLVPQPSPSNIEPDPPSPSEVETEPYPVQDAAKLALEEAKPAPAPSIAQPPSSKSSCQDCAKDDKWPTARAPIRLKTPGMEDRPEYNPALHDSVEEKSVPAPKTGPKNQTKHVKLEFRITIPLDKKQEGKDYDEKDNGITTTPKPTLIIRILNGLKMILQQLKTIVPIFCPRISVKRILNEFDTIIKDNWSSPKDLYLGIIKEGKKIKRKFKACWKSYHPNKKDPNPLNADAKRDFAPTSKIVTIPEATIDGGDAHTDPKREITELEMLVERFDNQILVPLIEVMEKEHGEHISADSE